MGKLQYPEKKVAGKLAVLKNKGDLGLKL